MPFQKRGFINDIFLFLSMKIYLHQFLSRTGVFSSKKVLIEALRRGEVTIDGKVVADSMFQFNPNTKNVFWKGKELIMLNKKIYFIMHKPAGYVCAKLSARDHALGKRSVFEIIEKDPKLDSVTKNSLFTVGRLDEDTSGLLIVTNDGDLGSRVTHPQHCVRKVYEVQLKKPLKEQSKKRIEEGIIIDLEENGKIEHYKTKPCVITQKTPTRLTITLIEGKKREIRRMFEKVNNPVFALKRIAIGNLFLDSLKLAEGEYCFVERELLEKKIF